MTASTRIIIDERTDVLRVPNQAVRYIPGGLAGAAANGTNAEQARIWVLRNGQPVSVAVKLGLEDDNVTEIVSGDVAPGDPVIVGEDRSGADAALATPRF